MRSNNIYQALRGSLPWVAIGIVGFSRLECVMRRMHRHGPGTS